MEIRQRCKEIQAGWTRRKRAHRLGLTDVGVEWLPQTIREQDLDPSTRAEVQNSASDDYRSPPNQDRMIR